LTCFSFSAHEYRHEFVPREVQTKNKIPYPDSMALKHLACLIAVAHFVSSSLEFLSRPDLSPPRLNITVPASPQTEVGYLFFTAARGDTSDSAGPDQPGAYIFRDNGELVWSGVGYWAGWVADFSPIMVNGKPALRAFQGDVLPATGRMLGNHALLDNSYRTISVIHAATHRLSSAHEFEVVNESSVLIETPIMTVADLSSYGGKKDQRFLLEGGFQGELSPAKLFLADRKYRNGFENRRAYFRVVI
jgi:hypothetical protein